MNKGAVQTHCSFLVHGKLINNFVNYVVIVSKKWYNYMMKSFKERWVVQL